MPKRSLPSVNLPNGQFPRKATVRSWVRRGHKCHSAIPMAARRVIAVVVCLAVLAVLSAAVHVGIREQQLIARQSNLGGKFAQLKLALQNYPAINGAFPAIHSPAPLARSWRVELLPSLELSDVYDKYAPDEPWDSPHNREGAASLKIAPGFYRSPFSDVQESEFGDFLAVDEQDAARLGRGGRNVLTVTIDGDNFLVVEMPNSRVHWMDPRDGQ